MNYRLISGVVCAEVFDEYFLIASLEARNRVDPVRALNETGAFFWKLLEECVEPEAAIARITQEYEVSEEDARAAFEAFCASLRDAGYLIMEDETA